MNDLKRVLVALAALAVYLRGAVALGRLLGAHDHTRGPA